MSSVWTPVLLLSGSGADKSRPHPASVSPASSGLYTPTLRAEGDAAETPHGGCRGSVSHTPRCGLRKTHIVPSPSGRPLFLIPSSFPQGSDMLACHNYWHWALYLIEKVSWLAHPVSTSGGRAVFCPSPSFVFRGALFCVCPFKWCPESIGVSRWLFWLQPLQALVSVWTWKSRGLPAVCGDTSGRVSVLLG